MIYNTIVEKNEEGLRTILRAAEKFNEDRFLDGIRMRSYTAEDIQQMTGKVRVFLVRLELVSRALARFAETFLQQYATDNNECFETAQKLFNRIRSTVSASRKVFKKTCPTLRRRQPVMEHPSIYSRSVLSRNGYNQDLFGIESFEESVQTLYCELRSFFIRLVNTLILCHEIIKKEREIMADATRCTQIYEDCERKLMDSVKEMLKYFPQTKDLPSSEMAERKSKARSKQEFYKENYHKWNSTDFKLTIASDLVRKGRNNGLTDLETSLWPKNYEQAFRVKGMISRIDQLEGITNANGKITGGTMVELVKWDRVEPKNEKAFYEYFCDEYKKQGGKFRLPGWSAVSQERKNRRDLLRMTDEEMINSFEGMISQLPAEE